MRKVLLSAICAVFAALFLLFPMPFLTYTRNKVLEHWLSGGKLAYEGKIVVWAVDAKVDGKQALMSWLRSRVSFFEKNHFGIYPELASMTMEDVTSRLQKGERPDVLLCGVDAPRVVLDCAAAYEGPFLMKPVLPQLYGGLLTPVLQSGTVVLINEDALYRAGLNPPAGLVGMEAQWLKTVSEEIPNALAYEDGVSLMAAVVSEMPADLQQAFIKSKTGTLEAFLKGDIAVYLTYQNALWQLYRQDLLGKTLPGITAYPLAGFTAKAECVALIKNEDKHRQQAAAAFVTTLLGRQAQSALAEIYALPTVSGTSCTRADLSALWQKAEETIYIYPGNGLEEFLLMTTGNASLPDLKNYVQGLCQPP